MNEIAAKNLLPPTTAEENERLEDLLHEVEKFPPVDLKTEHHLHAGVYSRTIYVPAGTAVVGLLIRVPTQLVACGHFQLTDGGRTKEFRGYHVLDGNKHRRAAVLCFTNCAFTMLFATKAKTVEEAENEFTDEPERLLTRKEKLICQEQPLQAQSLP